MTSTGKARRLTIVLGEDDTWHGEPLYTEIEPLVTEGLMTLGDVEVVRYVGRGAGAPPEAS